MFIPTWFLYICYCLGAFFLLSAIYTKASGNLVLLGNLRHSVTNQKKAVTALSIYLLITAILASSVPLLAANIGKSASYVFIVYLLFSVIFWYTFQSKWVGPINKKK